MNSVHNWTSPRNQKEVTTPVKHVLLPVHVKMAAGMRLSFTGKGGCCRGFQLCITVEEKGGARHSSQQFQQSPDRRVKQWKNGQQFTLLRRITNSSVNSDIVLPSIFSLERLSPKGSYHLVGQRYEWHTCSETSYRITDVECIVRAQTLQLNLTGEIGWLGVRNSEEEFFLRPC